MCLRKGIALTLVFVALVLWGCSHENVPPAPTEDGRIVAQDVPAGVQELLERNTPTDDAIVPLQNSAEPGESSPNSALAGYDIYAVTILWGHLFNLESPPSVTVDWSGTLSVNGVAIVSVRQTIDFEEGQDSVLPSVAPHYAEWVSWTTGDLDGLSFLVYLDRDVVYIVPPELTFDTGPFTMSWDFETLAHFCACYVVNNVHAVAIYSRKVWPNVCPYGFIRGDWVKTEIFADSGFFSGFWCDRYSEPIGYLGGTFWTESNGERLFAGSVSGLVTDEVIAELHGTWWYDDPRLCPLCGAGHGQFRGRFTYVSRPGGGNLWGEFGDYSLPVEELVLPMSGMWREDCPTLTPPDPAVAAE